jgi:hypothetical protein
MGDVEWLKAAGADGMERVVAALARHKAVKAGEDPDMAADIAEGEAATRRMMLAVRCSWCKAKPGAACVDYKRRPLTKTLVHPSRREAAEAAQQDNYRGAA